MVKSKTFVLIALLTLYSSVHAQDNVWQEYMRYMTYSPRYFGPNAFPLPELRSGTINNRYEVEIRGEYHTYEGDQTKDIYGRIFIPVAAGKAGIEVSYSHEYYYMTRETVEERQAAGQTWKNGARGDVIVSAFYELFGKNKWIDIQLEATLKTASGKRLSDARHTDAASYWFDLNFSRNLIKKNESATFLRLQGLAGFYCWMTNSIVHRQNDAFLYSGGINGGYKKWSIQADIVGFYGYRNNGDRPLILRTKLNFEHKKNVLSFRYRHGINDFLYDTYSLAYIRCFF
jgi:hypothetical protein